MKQPDFFDVEDRLEAFSRTADFEVFRPFMRFLGLGCRTGYRMPKWSGSFANV